MISEGLSVVHGTGQRGGRRRPRGGLLVRQEADPPDPQAPRGRFALGHLGGAPDLQDGHAETAKRARGEGARRAVVQGGWPWPTASVLQPEQELRDPLPGGVHAHDPLRPEFHRGKARAGRRRAAPPAAGARGPRCEPQPNSGFGSERPSGGAREDPGRGRLHGRNGKRPEERRRDARAQLPDYGRRRDVSGGVRRRAGNVSEPDSCGCRDLSSSRRRRSRMPVPDSSPGSPAGLAAIYPMKSRRAVMIATRPARPRNVPIRKNPKLSRDATPQTTASFQFFRWMAMIPPKIAKACA